MQIFCRPKIHQLAPPILCDHHVFRLEVTGSPTGYTTAGMHVSPTQHIRANEPHGLRHDIPVNDLL